MTGRVFIVTGANSGIGYETARYLCEGGNDVVMACRDETKGQSALDKIKSENPNALVALLKLDLGSLESIRKFVDDFHSTGKKLNVLINNAGLSLGSGDRERKTTSDNFELTMGTNHLGHFLLTNLLLADLERTAEATGDARIVTVTSEAHNPEASKKRNPAIQALDLENFMLHKYNTYNSQQAYKDSKLCNIMFTYELARRLQGTNVTVNAVCPGFVPSSNFSRNENAVNRFLTKWILHRALRFTHVTRTIGQAAQSVINAATNEELKGVTGKYFLELGEHLSSSESLDEDTQKKLWDLSAGLVKLDGYEPITPPEVEAPPPPPEPIKTEEVKKEETGDVSAATEKKEKPDEQPTESGDGKPVEVAVEAVAESKENEICDESKLADTTADESQLSTTMDDSAIPPDSSFNESGLADTTADMTTDVSMTTEVTKSTEGHTTTEVIKTTKVMKSEGEGFEQTTIVTETKSESKTEA